MSSLKKKTRTRLISVHLYLPGQLPLNRAVMLLDAAVLNRLKREFGGLQTLLRNEHQVFEGGWLGDSPINL